MKIDEGILPGALVKCIDDEMDLYYKGIQRGQLYTISATSLHGACVYVVGSTIPYIASRFQLIYNDRENFNQPDYYDGVWH